MELTLVPVALEGGKRFFVCDDRRDPPAIDDNLCTLSYHRVEERPIIKAAPTKEGFMDDPRPAAHIPVV